MSKKAPTLRDLNRMGKPKGLVVVLSRPLVGSPAYELRQSPERGYRRLADFPYGLFSHVPDRLAVAARRRCAAVIEAEGRE